MTTPDKQNKAFFWATVFLRELHSCGVRQLVISPGSRSAPLVLAAAAHPGFERHVVLDERSAGFIALGIGRASGIPAALICTSGTAVANYYPAVIEARESGVPLILLTADRPPILRNNGAPQAIDQVNIFGNYPVFFHEAGEPLFESSDLARLQQAADQAFSISTSRQGPAHINFPFRKPLEPDPGFLESIRSENDNIATGTTAPVTSVLKLQERLSLPEELRRLIEESVRPLVISAPSSPSRSATARVLAGWLGAPLLSEFNSNSDDCYIHGFSGFLMDPGRRNELKPDLIIRFGRQPTGKALQLFLDEHHGCNHIHFADLNEWHDAGQTVSHRINWFGRDLEWDTGSKKKQSGWLKQWKMTEKKFLNQMKKATDAETELTDGHLFYHLGGTIPATWNLFLSNSLPVRDWMLFSDTPFPGPVYVNRGASGIDGVISSAIGSTIESKRPGILFIGDLATLHDSNALLSSKLLDQPLVLILINNGGGNIFRMLPIYEHRDLYVDFFETPQQADFQKLAQTYLTGYHRVDTQVKLLELEFEKLFTTPGIHLVECITDADRSMDLRKSLREQRYGEN